MCVACISYLNQLSAHSKPMTPEDPLRCKECKFLIQNRPNATTTKSKRNERESEKQEKENLYANSLAKKSNNVSAPFSQPTATADTIIASERETKTEWYVWEKEKRRELENRTFVCMYAQAKIRLCWKPNKLLFIRMDLCVFIWKHANSNEYSFIFISYFIRSTNSSRVHYDDRVSIQLKREWA